MEYLTIDIARDLLTTFEKEYDSTTMQLLASITSTALERKITSNNGNYTWDGKTENLTHIVQLNY